MLNSFRFNAVLSGKDRELRVRKFIRLVDGLLSDLLSVLCHNEEENNRLAGIVKRKVKKKALFITH
jgi:hypothetical protein